MDTVYLMNNIFSNFQNIFYTQIKEIYQRSSCVRDRLKTEKFNKYNYKINFLF